MYAFKYNLLSVIILIMKAQTVGSLRLAAKHGRLSTDKNVQVCDARMPGLLHLPGNKKIPLKIKIVPAGSEACHFPFVVMEQP